MQQSNQQASKSRSSQRSEKQQQVPQNAGKKGKGLGLLQYITGCPERREDGGVTPPLPEGQGRFKYFWEVAKRRNSSVLMANLMFVIFTLPLLAVFAAVLALGGVERIAYLLQGISAPYLMTNIGFGISSSAYTVQSISAYATDVYYLIFAAAGVGALIMSIGLSGMMPLCMKFIIGDSFRSKKDNYGNDVPKAFTEFFLGIKKYWAQFLLVGFLFFLVLAGNGNAIVFFVSRFHAGCAGAGEWILVLVSSALALLTLMFTMHLMPIIVLYDIPLKDKVKNALVFTFYMFLQNLFVLIAFAVPFVLIGVLESFISSIVVAVLLVFGTKYYCLTMCNYEQYLSEKIVVPFYNVTSKKSKKSKK